MAREEIELKFRVAAAPALRARLRHMGFRVAAGRRRETNWMFDDAQGRLRAGGRLLRLRRSGDAWLLTAKGKRRPGPLKRRAEWETAVADGAGCRGLLALLGYRPTLAYARWRTLWQRPGEAGEVAWDETRFGVYLEIEGSAAWVRRTARELGLRVEQAEPRSYPEIYAAGG
ncbi:MAG TPA: class IV adenylate cyclase [Terriglobales bacterium]|nr:class IV adenylate cyclase [Terriglobales bacterium]